MNSQSPAPQSALPFLTPRVLLLIALFFSTLPSPSSGQNPPIWETITNDISGEPQPRHEACFVMVNGKGFLLGGRGRKDTDIFDPIARTWTKGRRAPVDLHHMQCVAYDSKVWIVSAWHGGFPNEQNRDNIYVYDTVADAWSTRPGLPEPRRRGGAAAVLFDNKIYVVAGNRGGHGSPGMTLGFMDYYDLNTNTWTTNLPDLPEPRDHVGGAIVNGDKLCIAGGRDGGAQMFFNAVVESTYCYIFATGSWRNMNADIPLGRAGAATGTTCAGHMMIVGGEGTVFPAYDRVDIFNGNSWRTAPSLQRGRHGTGLAISRCSCGQIFITSGSGNRGGGPELDSTEVYLPSANDGICSQY